MTTERHIPTIRATRARLSLGLLLLSRL